MSAESDGRPHALVLARNFPNSAFPTLGIWAERLVQAAVPVARSTVLAPVPWIPPGLPSPMARRYRSVPSQREESYGTVLHPRVPILPGHRLHAWEARLQWPFVWRAALEVHRRDPIAVVHAHFIYPEGVMAVRLARELGVPAVTTEHAFWIPWVRQWPAVHRQVLAAAPGLARITTVSAALAASVREVLGPDAPVELLPNVVDEVTFRARRLDEPRDGHQLVFVGAVRRVKGLDLLVEALALLRPKYPALRLIVVGEAFYGGWKRDERAVRDLTQRLGLGDCVHFVGRRQPAEVAAVLRASAMLVVPSRRESFSAAAIEALASGIPVVATRCGGPEEFLTGETGRLVAPNSPVALADGIRAVLDDPGRFPAATLHDYAVARFGWAASTARLAGLYQSLLGR